MFIDSVYNDNVSNFSIFYDEINNNNNYFNTNDIFKKSNSELQQNNFNSINNIFDESSNKENEEFHFLRKKSSNQLLTFNDISKKENTFDENCSKISHIPLQKREPLKQISNPTYSKNEKDNDNSCSKTSNFIDILKLSVKEKNQNDKEDRIKKKNIKLHMDKHNQRALNHFHHFNDFFQSTSSSLMEI